MQVFGDGRSDARALLGENFWFWAFLSLLRLQVIAICSRNSPVLVTTSANAPMVHWESWLVGTRLHSLWAIDWYHSFRWVNCQKSAQKHTKRMVWGFPAERACIHWDLSFPAWVLIDAWKRPNGCRWSTHHAVNLRRVRTVPVTQCKQIYLRQLPKTILRRVYSQHVSKQ